MPKFALAAAMLLTSGSVAAAAGLGKLPAWDGFPSPKSKQAKSEFLGVAAVAADAVWAVGYRDQQTLAARWDGHRFVAVSTPKSGARAGILEEVAGSSAGDVWAVGHLDRTDFVGSKTLILHWDGEKWSVVSSPSFGGPDDENVLSGVAAVSPSDAWAVGWYRNINPDSARALTFHWDGSSWTEVKNSCGRGLNNVFALSKNNIWAVGALQTCNWTGKEWVRHQADEGPNPQLAIDLQDVSGVASDNLWAVGYGSIECGESVCFTGVIEHWDGRQWVFQGSPTILYGVRALSAKNVYAAGLGKGAEIIHYDGSEWVTVPAPNPIRVGALYGIDALSADDLWSAGSQYVDGTQQTLAEHAASPISGAVFGPTGVSGATVSWTGPESGSVETDVSGQFQAGGLKAGKYQFVASYAGCSPAVKKQDVLAGRTISIALKISCSN